MDWKKMVKFLSQKHVSTDLIKSNRYVHVGQSIVLKNATKLQFQEITLTELCDYTQAPILPAFIVTFA